MHEWGAEFTNFFLCNLILIKIVMLSSVKVCRLFSIRECVQVFDCLFTSACQLEI